jgi:peptidoglycan/xylan/chitin deacetylase (PgdA/CDA1 family)
MTSQREYQSDSSDTATYAHSRPFRPVHDRIPYSPIGKRTPIHWPQGAGVAVWIAPNIEHYEYLPPPGAVDPYPRSVHPDVRKFTYHEYGNRVGFWRMIAAFDEFDVRPTASLNVAVLEHYPEIANAMYERDWEFMSHGLYNTRYVSGMVEDQERAFLEFCDRILFRNTGKHFRGMLGPNITGNPWSADLMAEIGMQYHADWVHDERPSPLLTTSDQPMVALPYRYELNDAPLLMRAHIEADDWAQRCILQFDQLARDAAAENSGRMMAIPLHPFVIGQPHRIGSLRTVLAHLRQHGAWIATAEEIVDHYLENAYESDLEGATCTSTPR